MARRRRDEGPRLDHAGQKPLLQGHLRVGGAGAGETGDGAAPTVEASSERSAQPAEDVPTSANEADAVRGRATKSPADVATRPHLEGSEQGPA